MKQIFITAKGGVEVLKIVESSEPEPVDDQVKVRVMASGINFADIMARLGTYPDAPPIPCVVGYEISGIVEKVGPKADQSLLHQAVVGLTPFGGYSSVVCVSERLIARKPRSLSFAEAACVPVVYLTAWFLMYEMGGLRKGNTILIQNAGGAVGLAAIDIANHIGAISIGTCSAHKHEFVKERGLAHAIDYNKENVHEKVMKITQGKGVDLIIDPLGGESWHKSYELLRAGGRVGFFGASSTYKIFKRLISNGDIFTKVKMISKLVVSIPWFFWSPVRLMADNKGVFGVNMLHLFDDDRLQPMLQMILDACGKDGWARPFVDKKFSYEEIGEAHKYIEARKNIGKVIIEWPSK